MTRLIVIVLAGLLQKRTDDVQIWFSLAREQLQKALNSLLEDFIDLLVLLRHDVLPDVTCDRLKLVRRVLGRLLRESPSSRCRRRFRFQTEIATGWYGEYSTGTPKLCFVGDGSISTTWPKTMRSNPSLTLCTLPHELAVLWDRAVFVISARRASQSVSITL